ncbi:MAG: MATE family efflux transporter [Spirochaetaceae bacterium]|nr:MATE family efflux transporter [Spirochaetaceae bacterium]
MNNLQNEHLQNEDRQNEKFARMTGEPVEKLVCSLALPSIVIMLISALYNMADTYFVSSLGTSAVAAVGVVFPLMAVIQAIGFFFGHGSGNYISRQLGAREIEAASKMAATGFFSALILCALLGFLGLFGIDSLSRILGATSTILPYARDYMRFILIGAPWMAGSLVLNNQLRFQGSAAYGMAGMISGAVLNMILDPLFIFGLGLGVTGASLATAISQFVGCAVLVLGTFRKGNISIRFRGFSPSPYRYKEMIRGGLPSLFRQGLASLASVLINHAAGAYGDGAIAAITIVNRVTMFAASALVGFGQGFQPVCGFNYGAKLYGRVKKAFWFCVKSSFLVLFLIAAAGFILAPQVIALFRREDAEVIRIGALSLRLHCIVFPLTGWVILCNMMMQTIGKPVEASLLAMSRQGLFLVPFLYILTPLFGLPGIQISQPASDLAAFFFAIPLAVKVLKGMRN